jgi:hypothetical protein
MLGVCKLLKMAGEPCKPDSVACILRKAKGRILAIIPLGHGSRRDSSSLPEGCSLRRLACLWQAAPSQSERAFRSSRPLSRLTAQTGSASRAGLSPPIWPCTTRGFPRLRCHHRSGGLLPHLFTLAQRSERCEDVPQVFLRDVTGLDSAGGLFSVALSVANRTAAGSTRRHALARVTLPRGKPCVPAP